MSRHVGQLSNCVHKLFGAWGVRFTRSLFIIIELPVIFHSASHGVKTMARLDLGSVDLRLASQPSSTATCREEGEGRSFKSNIRGR